MKEVQRTTNLIDFVDEDDARLFHGLHSVSRHLRHVQPFLDLHVFDQRPRVFNLSHHEQGFKGTTLGAPSIRIGTKIRLTREARPEARTNHACTIDHSRPLV